MNREFARIAWMLFSALAGLCVWLVLLNRWLIQIRDSRLKGPVILTCLALLTGGGAAAGFAFPGLPWSGVPAGLLLLIAAGEARRVVLRRVHAGSPPLDSVPHQVSYLRPVTTTDVVTHRYRVELRGWRGRPFRVVHLSDLHVSPSIPEAYFARVLDLAGEAEPDLVFLTGDLVSRADAVPMLARVLRQAGKRGTFAVLGNHDYWAGADAVRAVVRSSGIRLLTNESARVEMDGGAIRVAGCDYPWGADDCVVPDPGEEVPRLVLSHTPDNIYRLAGQSADIVFSGHYHAGQMRIPLLGSVVVPSAYGRRFDHGHFVVRGTHLFVAAGVGASGPSFRLYCQPDLFVIDVTGGDAA